MLNLECQVFYLVDDTYLQQSLVHDIPALYAIRSYINPEYHLLSVSNERQA